MRVVDVERFILRLVRERGGLSRDEILELVEEELGCGREVVRVALKNLEVKGLVEVRDVE